LNQKANGTAFFGINKWADQSPEELKQHLGKINIPLEIKNDSQYQ